MPAAPARALGVLLAVAIGPAIVSGCTRADSAARPTLRTAASACADPSAPPSALAKQCTPTPIRSEGSVTGADGGFVRYPKGLIVRLAKLDRLDRKLSSDIQSDEALIRVTVTLENTGAEPFELRQNRSMWSLLYGVNRYQAEEALGLTGKTDQLESKDPARVAPGEKVAIFDSAKVPTAELGVLAVRAFVAPGVLTAYVFTDAQTLLT